MKLSLKDSIQSMTMKVMIMTAMILGFTTVQAQDIEPSPAPDFTLPSEGGGQSGINIKLSELKGQVVLINFWASWCAPCREEMPLLNDIYNKYKDLGVTLLGINVESETEKAMEFLAKTPVDFPILLDKTNAVTELYKVDAMPTTVIVDRNGDMRVLHRGYKKGYEDLYEDDIKKLARGM